MRVRNHLLVAVAALAMAMPARADLLLTFRTVNQNPATPTTNIRNDYLPFPTPLAPANRATNAILPTGLVMNVGDIRYVVVDFTANSTNMGPNQAQWTGNYGMTQYGMNMTFNGSTADNPYTPYGTPPTQTENLPNLSQQAPFGPAYPNQPYGPNYRQVLGLTTAPLAGNGDGTLDEACFFAFKITAVAPGTTNYVFSQYTAGPGGAPTPVIVLSKNVAGTDLNLDQELFSPAHPTFTLPVTVVPEPTSMCLAGMAFAGLGYRLRKLRKKTV
jgi:hypothetical protein